MQQWWSNNLDFKYIKKSIDLICKYVFYLNYFLNYKKCQRACCAAVSFNKLMNYLLHNVWNKIEK